MGLTEDELIVEAELRLGGDVKGRYWWYPLHPAGGANTDADFIWHLVHADELKGRWGLCWAPFNGQHKQKKTPPDFSKLCRQCVRTYAVAKPVLF